MKFKKSSFVLLTLLLLLSGHISYSQEVTLKVKNQSLNTVLIGLRETYRLEMSFNDRQLSRYFVTTDTVFPGPEAAIRGLIAGFPLSLELHNNVFVIAPLPGTINDPGFVVEGKVRDASSMKSLPYSYVSLNNRWMEADLSGRFYFPTAETPPYNLKISYLGYYVLDTIVNPGAGYTFDLKQADYPVGEVIIPGKMVLKSIQGGNNAGEISLNHHIAGFLPGNGDNSVFNLLRLQPGICAAGELANDLIIWGSYEG